MSADDPTVAGAGWNRAVYLSRKLGENFVQTLYRDQQVETSREERQQVDWLARGQHPIALGLALLWRDYPGARARPRLAARVGMGTSA